MIGAMCFAFGIILLGVYYLICGVEKACSYDKKNDSGGFVWDVVFSKRDLLSGCPVRDTDELRKNEDYSYVEQKMLYTVDVMSESEKEYNSYSDSPRDYRGAKKSLPKDVFKSLGFFVMEIKPEDDIDFLKRHNLPHHENVPKEEREKFKQKLKLAISKDEYYARREINNRVDHYKFWGDAYEKIISAKKWLAEGKYFPTNNIKNGMTNIFLYDFYADYEYFCGYKPEISMHDIRVMVLATHSQNPWVSKRIRDIYCGKEAVAGGKEKVQNNITIAEIKKLKNDNEIENYLNEKAFPLELRDEFFKLKNSDEDEFANFIKLYNQARRRYDNFLVGRVSSVDRVDFNVFSYDPWKKVRDKYGYEEKSEKIEENRAYVIEKILIDLKMMGDGCFKKEFGVAPISKNSEWGFSGNKYYRDENGKLQRGFEKDAI